MKNFISKILDQPTQQPIFKFVPQIKISSNSTLHLEVQPNDPHTASNIVINAYISKTNRTIVPIKVQWSRYKFKSDQQYTIEKIPSVTGNTYMCQPSDLGSIIQAKVKCLDQSVGGQGQASIGPIRIDAMLKRLIDGALYNQSLLSQTIIVEGQQKLNVNLRLGYKTMQFQQIDSNQKLTMNYTFSQPKIQLSPKDPCKVYLRFQQDKQNVVRNWLNKVTGIQKNNMNNLNQSSMSMKIPHSNVSAVSSKNKLFQKSHNHCVNKFQVRFLSRNSRDLFLFTLRAFICKQDMKNSLVMQRIQTLQALKNQQDYTKFLQYLSLKSEIIRLAQLAKQLQTDRDNKVKDINNMEESISQMTLTYLKIIQQKSQNQHVDLQQSYSMISMKREQILGRKQFRQLKNENDQLKNQVRDLNQQIELQRFFRKDQNNESMLFNRTMNPFLKKQSVNISNIVDQNQSGNYNLNIQNRSNEPVHKNMLQISKSYMKVLQENKKLKQKSQHKNINNQSRDIQNLLESLHENQQSQAKIIKMEAQLDNYRKDILRLKDLNSKLDVQNNQLHEKLNKQFISQANGTNNVQHHQIHNLNISASHRPALQNSYYSRTSAQNQSMLSNSYMSMNQSMTSEAQLNQLQKKLIQLSNLNTKFEAENMRLRKQRDYYRSLYDTELSKNKININAKSETPTNDIPGRNTNLSSNRSLRQNDKINDSQMFEGNNQNSTIMRLRQQKQKLQNQKNSLLKRIDSLTRQSNALMRPDTNLQKKCQQIMRQNQKLIQQNYNLQKTIQNMRNFHQLQKKQLSQNKGDSKLSSSNSSGSSTQLIQIKEQEIAKQKKVNMALLEQIKQIKMQLQRKNDVNLDNSRVIELQNQLHIFKTYAKGGSIGINAETSPQKQNNELIVQNEDLLKQVGQLKKQNQRLRQQNANLELKIKTQTNTIQKLMTELDQFNRSQILSDALQIDNSFNKKYLTPSSSKNPEETQKYKKKITQLQAELNILRKNTQAVNRSRDLSMSMMGYDQQRLQIYKKQNESLMLQNQNLSNMCSKYAKDARQANIQLNKIRQKMMQMNKEKFLTNQL